MQDLIKLPELTARINQAHQSAHDAMRQGVAHALEAGRLLAEAKQAVGHGRWGEWVSANCTFSDRTARAYMRLAREFPGLDEANRQRVADLPLREALLMLADTKPMEVGTTHDIRIDDIVIGERFRKDLGDLNSLAASIAKIGLLQPILVNSQMVLVCGQRRLVACRSLGWETIPATITDVPPLLGEWAENMERS